MTLDALLRSACEALHSAGIPFMLTGSAATAFHGSSRATMDIDFVIDPETGWKADLIIRKNRPLTGSSASLRLDKNAGRFTLGGIFRLVSDHLHRLQTVYDHRFARRCSDATSGA